MTIAKHLLTSGVLTGSARPLEHTLAPGQESDSLAFAIHPVLVRSPSAFRTFLKRFRQKLTVEDNETKVEIIILFEHLAANVAHVQKTAVY